MPLATNAAQVSYVSGETQEGIVGEVVTAGQAVYYNDVDGRWWRAKSNGTALEAGSAGIGIALGSGGIAGQKIGVTRPGCVVNLGAASAAVAGTAYFASSTVGSLSPQSEIGTTQKATVVGLGIGGTQIITTRVYHPTAVAP